MKIYFVSDDKDMKLEDVERGSLFLFKGTIAMKTEYGDAQGAIEAYIIGSGERFWGGVTNPLELNKLIVQPLKLISSDSTKKFNIQENKL